MADNNKEQLDAYPDTLLGNSENVAKMVTHRYDPEYNMGDRRNGLALLFGHTKFAVEGVTLPQRSETDKDMEDLKKVLHGLKFEVHIYPDFKYDALMDKIKKAARHNHKNNGCILVSIMTHGINDHLYAADKPYELDTIWSAFTADKCGSLAGKPKIFVVQASQGCKDAGVKMVKTARRTETDGISTKNNRIPIHADFLMAICTNPVGGSWFIQSLCKELKDNGRRYDMLQLLTFVAQRVASNFETYEEQYKQMPSTMSTMTRILRFK